MTVEGKRIALTGKLRRFSRSDATSQLEDLGAEVTAVVTDGTDLVIAGMDAVLPEDSEVPVIDENGLEKLLSGEPLAAILGPEAPPEPQRPPLPAITWERDGMYRRADAERRIAVEGPMRDARMHGTWRYLWPNGEPSREVEMVDGLEHGNEREWNQRGIATYHGQNERGKSVGTCEWFYDDGQTCSTATEFRDGDPHGEHREYHPDGSPRVIGRNVRGLADGVWSWIGPDGTRTERRYHAGFLVATPSPIEADEKTIEKVVRAVKKARDRWDKESALDAIPSDGARFVLMHLWRLRALDPATEPQLWELLAEAAIDPACGVTGAELMEILSAISPKLRVQGAHLDGWPLALDRAVCHVFLRDPEPFVAGWTSTPPAIRRGIESVLARAGTVDKARLGDLAEPMAKALVGAHAIPKLPRLEEGDAVDRALVDVDGVPTAHFDALVALYASFESWGRASLARAFARGVKEVDLARMHAAARFATEAQLVALVDRAHRPESIAAFLLASPLPADTLAQVAVSVEPVHQHRAAWAAIIRHGEAGLPIPVEVLAVTSFAGACDPDARAIERAIAELPTHRKDEPAVRATFVKFAPDHHPLLRGLELPIRAARTLGSHLPAVLRRDLAAGHALAVAPLLHVVDDPAFLDSALAALRVMPPSPTRHLVGVALGMLPITALPLLVAAHDSESDPDTREWLAVAIVAVLAHAGSTGVTWDAAYDRFLRTDLGETVEERRYIDPLECAAIAALPEARGEAVLLANMDPAHRERFTRAFALIGTCATPRIMAHSLYALLDLEPTLLDSDLERVEIGLGGLVEPNEWVRWLLAAGAGSRLGSALVAVAGNEEKLEALRAQVVASGARVARVLDSIDVIEAMAARFAESAQQTVYFLRRVDVAPSDAGFNRIGGVPVGITTRKWPKRRGKPMHHVLTLDVATMPALGKQLGDDARTISLFVASLESKEPLLPNTDWAKLVVVGTKEAAKGELAPPPTVTIREPSWFETVPVDLPTAVFGAKSGTLRELRAEIAKHPRVLGEASWTRAPLHEGSFLAQFDDRFADLTLGNGGRVFVFQDTAFWQPR